MTTASNSGATAGDGTVLELRRLGSELVISAGGHDAILLDVDNGPIALAHGTNDALYGEAGLAAAREALVEGGTLALWSLRDDPRFTRRLEAGGFAARVHRVFGSRRGRGREHVIWTARPRP